MRDLCSEIRAIALRLQQRGKRGLKDRRIIRQVVDPKSDKRRSKVEHFGDPRFLVEILFPKRLDESDNLTCKMIFDIGAAGGQNGYLGRMSGYST